MFQKILESWPNHHVAWLVSMAISLAAYLAIALAIPRAIARIPADYFARPPRRRSLIARLLLAAVGLAIVAVGVALLFLPGPGVLAILLGLSIMGGGLAERLVRRLIARPRVLEAFNKIRERRGKPPLVPPGGDPRDSA